MKFYLLCVALLTIHVGFAAGLSQIEHYYLLPEQLYYDVTCYDLDLVVDVSGSFVQGQMGVCGQILHPGTSQIVLNLVNAMRVDSVKSGIFPLIFTHQDHVLNIDLPQPLNSGDPFSVTVFYHGYPRQGAPAGYGLLFTSFDGQPLVYSYHWPYYANTYLPCKDHPSDKADSVRLAITVPNTLQVAANGTLQQILPVTGNRNQFIWKSQYPITPYHISLNIYPFDIFQSTYNSPLSGTIPLSFFLFPLHSGTARPRLESVVPAILQAFESRFGPFPFSQDKFGICESVISGGMEHQTLLTMNYPSFFSDIVVHESAHEYFGNMIAIADWGHIWLSEGFATYCQAIYREYWEGPSGYEQEISAHMGGAGNGVIYVSDHSSPNNIIPYSLVYLKASTVVHMLRYVMGDSLFFQMMRDYVALSPFRYGNIDTDQFRLFCEGYHGSDLSWFFDQWIYRDGKMAAEFYHYWNTARDSLIVKVRSVPSAPSVATIHRMPVPLLISTAGRQVVDTLWIDSTAYSQSYQFPDTANLQVQFDPQQKILKGPFTFLDRPRFSQVSVLPNLNGLDIILQPFFDFSEYEIFTWFKQSAGNYLPLDTLVTTSLNIFRPLYQTGTYRLAFRARNQDHCTALSDYREVNFSTFPMDQGILIVDETRDGNGSHMLLPTDETVDQFYSALLSGFTCTPFDIAAEGRIPTVLELGQYAAVIWHHEVTHPTLVGEAQAELEVYLQAGGKVIFSGMNYLSSFSAEFRNRFLGIEQVLLNTSPDFIEARSPGDFPALPVDTAKITFALYNKKLPNVMALQAALTADTMYQYISASLDPLYHLKPVGVRITSPGDSLDRSAVTLGFPLFFVRFDSARAFMIRALSDFGIAVGIQRKTGQTERSFALSAIYPNPFNPSTKILFSLNRSARIDIFIYNLLGQKVRWLLSGTLLAGMHEVEWDGKNDDAIPLASGMYVVQISAGNRRSATKIILQR